MKKRGRPPKVTLPCPPPTGFCVRLKDGSFLTVEAKTVSWGSEWVQFWDCKGGEVYFVERVEVEEIVDVDSQLLAEVRTEGQDDTSTTTGRVTDTDETPGELAGELP